MFSRKATSINQNMNFAWLFKKFSFKINHFYAKFQSRCQFNSLSSYNRLLPWKYKNVLLSSSVTAFYCLSFDSLQIECEVDNSNKKIFAGDDLTQELKKRLNVVRRKFKFAHNNYPLIKVYSDKSLNIISIKVDDNSDVLKLYMAWLSVLYANNNSNGCTVSVVPSLSSLDSTAMEVPLSFIIENKSKTCGVIADSAGSTREIVLKCYKRDGFNQYELDRIVEGYYQCFANCPDENASFIDVIPKNFLKFFFGNDGEFHSSNSSLPFSDQSHDYDGNSNMTLDDSVEQLQRLGIDVYIHNPNSPLNWDSLAGYQHVKQDIEETIINSYKHPEIYDDITRRTRVVFESNRPKAILLEGPPGTGKTLTARILADKVEKPFIHLKLENIVSKWYGDAEKKLGQVFDVCDNMNGAIIFIDEIDTLASSRDTNQLHEATKHMLSVILQRIEGFDGKGKSLVICATNRKHDLDAALLSRFDIIIQYSLPDFQTRVDIYKYYAKQFSNNKDALNALANSSTGFSGRDLKEVCEYTERKFATKKINNTKGLEDLPVLKDYLESIEVKKYAIFGNYEKDQTLAV